MVAYVNSRILQISFLTKFCVEEGIESQAIDRCNRIGQTKNVRVYQLVAENTVEARVCQTCRLKLWLGSKILPQVLDIQEKKKNLIKQVSIFRFLIFPYNSTPSRRFLVSKRPSHNVRGKKHAYKVTFNSLINISCLTCVLDLVALFGVQNTAEASK